MEINTEHMWNYSITKPYQLNKIYTQENIVAKDYVVLENSEIINYTEFVEKLIKKFPENKPLEFLHGAIGVAGEAGELCDAIKKHIIYGKPLDRKNIVEELGDLEFYMQDIRAKYEISRSETLQANADKLGERYVGLVYTDKAAIERADKAEEYKEDIQAAETFNFGMTKEQQGSN